MFVIIKESEDTLLYPSQQTVQVGDTARFFCDSQRIKSWNFMDEKLPSNAKVSGKLNRVLTIGNIQMHNFGVYKCTISKSNKAFIKHTTFLFVEGKFSANTSCILFVFHTNVNTIMDN